jgi:hypothetical protein
MRPLVCICGEQEFPGVYLWRAGAPWCVCVERRTSVVSICGEQECLVCGEIIDHFPLGLFNVYTQVYPRHMSTCHASLYSIPFYYIFLIPISLIIIVLLLLYSFSYDLLFSWLAFRISQKNYPVFSCSTLESL